jgi:hypothetical protein
MLVALIAAGTLVAVPLTLRAVRTSSCLGPGDPGVVSVGTGIGSGVIALTVHPDGPGTVTVSVRTASAPGHITDQSTLWVSGPGASPTALGRRHDGCWQGRLPRSALAMLSVRAGTSGAEPVVARFAVPPGIVSAGPIVARARGATLALSSVRERTLGRSSVLEPPHAVDTLYAGDTVVSRSAHGIQRLVWPGWRAGFAWVDPGLEATVVLRRRVTRGVQVVTVAGAVADTPLWMVLEIDRATGLVLGDRMYGPGHIMSSTYTSTIR